jgi:predicted O-methyltransferase YrrM
VTLPEPTGLAFAGDGLLEKEIRRLIRQFNIQSAVETGTNQGVTARALAAMVPQVYTIEKYDATFAEARWRLMDVHNVQVYFGASPNVLPTLLPHVQRPTLYYLDAHWDGNYPLPQEVEIIAALDPQPIIVIHDMEVPGHPEFHADPQPDGSPYDYEWVRPFLEMIQMPWRYYYNEEAEGLQVGVLFIVPKETDEI